MISIIIPVRNEEKLLGRCLQSIQRQTADAEIMVVDGASQDRSVEIARQHRAEVIQLAEPGLARQLNAGAAQAKGDMLLFLHADAELTEGCLARLERLPETIVGGAFTMKVAGSRFFYRILSLGGDLYCRMTRTYFGDRGMFVRREAFLELGGYREMPIMTDVDFSRRMKSWGRTTLLSGPVLSSSRKFASESPWRILYLIFFALLAFHRGVDPEIIRKKYYGQ